jgi:glycosyltransferase involved in cell wall biosynthesis
MASHLPVVSTEIAGIPEIVQQNGNGLLVPEKDSGRLADAIRTIACNAAMLERFGNASRRIVEEKFSLCNTVGELKRLFVRQGLDP